MRPRVPLGQLSTRGDGFKPTSGSGQSTEVALTNFWVSILHTSFPAIPEESG